MANQHIDKLVDDIEKYGFGGDNGTSNWLFAIFAYTVGLWKNYKRSEFITLGMPLDILHTILNTVAIEGIKKGKSIEIGKNYHGVLEKHPVQFLTVDKRNIPDYFGQAINYYQTDNFPALQLIWPDNKGLFPYEAGFREDLIYLQPLLD